MGSNNRSEAEVPEVPAVPEREPPESSGIDLGRWVDPPIEDQSDHADFRREVAAIARDVLASFASGAPREPREPVEPGEPGEPGEPALSRGHFDLRETTPYLLVRAYRKAGARMTAGRRGTRGGTSAVLVRDLVLMEVARKWPITAGTLRRRLGMPAASLSTVVERSVRHGLLRRRRHPGDGRRWLIEPTDAGLVRADEAARAWRATDEALLGSLSPAERDELRRLLRRTASGSASGAASGKT